MLEEWRDTVGFHDYQVSNTGLVRSKLDGHIIKPHYTKAHPAEQYSLRVYPLHSTHRDKKTVYGHQLVGRAFLDESPFVRFRHIDGDRTHNNVLNLEVI